MKRLVLVDASGQAEGGGRPQPALGEAVYLGVDVSRSKWVYEVRWGGQPRRRLSTPGELRHLQAVVGEYAHSRVHVIYEACGFGYEIAWWCQQKRIDVLVVAPSTVEQAPGRRVKTDRLDADVGTTCTT